MDLVLLPIAFVIILFGAELFTNGIEWFGHKLKLAEGAVGSVLAAVGTALPETMIPIIAILFGTGDASHAVGIGADPGGAVHALDARDVRDRRGGPDLPQSAPDRRPRCRSRRGVLAHDMRYFAIAYALAVGVAFVPSDLRGRAGSPPAILLLIYALVRPPALQGRARRR